MRAAPRSGSDSDSRFRPGREGVPVIAPPAHADAQPHGDVEGDEVEADHGDVAIARDFLHLDRLQDAFQIDVVGGRDLLDRADGDACAGDRILERQVVKVIRRVQSGLFHRDAERRDGGPKALRIGEVRALHPRVDRSTKGEKPIAFGRGAPRLRGCAVDDLADLPARRLDGEWNPGGQCGMKLGDQRLSPFHAAKPGPISGHLRLFSGLHLAKFALPGLDRGTRIRLRGATGLSIPLPRLGFARQRPLPLIQNQPGDVVIAQRLHDAHRFGRGIVIGRRHFRLANFTSRR
jgi:hypothetical protein